MAGTKHILLMIALSATLLFFGCIQPAQASRCNSVAADLKDNCLWETAILYQEPYLCYSVNDAKVRESCLDGANNPATAQRIKDEKMLGRRPQAQAQATEPAAAEEQKANKTADMNNAIADANLPEPTRSIRACVKTQDAPEEACMRKVAIETRNMSLCADIVQKDYRTSCISNIASVTKSVMGCEVLKSSEDRSVCRYYAGG